MKQDWLKLTAWAALILGVLYFGRSIRGSSVVVYAQPQDNEVREITIHTVHDGDTVTADVCMGKIGRTEYWARNVRLRLKDVRAYEIDPKADHESQKIAALEHDALSAAVMATDAQPLTARLFRQTYDRYEAVIYTAKQNVNELMLGYPQGGR
jgi:hypothetical protein